MATKKKAAKPKARGVDLTLWGVILSYPDLNDPKPYKGKVYYRTDCLFEKNDPQLKLLKDTIHEVKVNAWGDDESEWPDEEKALIQNGDAREDSKGYAGRRFITASTQTPVPVVDPRGKAFNPQMVKGGMFANVAVRISSWEFDGDVGLSIYLQGVQIDTSKPSLNFGGGRSVEQMFKKSDASEHDEDAEESDEDEEPAPKKKKSKFVHEDNDEDDEDMEPGDLDEDDEPAPKSKKKARRNFDDDED